jgi:hypothetical protein
MKDLKYLLALLSDLLPGEAVAFENEEYVFVKKDFVPAVDRLQQGFHGYIHLANTQHHRYIHFDFSGVTLTYVRAQEQYKY